MNAFVKFVIPLLISAFVFLVMTTSDPKSTHIFTPVENWEHPFSVVMIGASGEVGNAVASAFLKSGMISRLTLINRRILDSFEGNDLVTQHVVDMSNPEFEKKVQELAEGADVAISCVGLGQGSYKMSMEQLTEIYVGVTGRFARGVYAAGVERFLLLTAVGEFKENSYLAMFRMMHELENMAINIGFKDLAIFKPGIITGNKHTPRYVSLITSLIPNSWTLSNIHQNELAWSFVCHLKRKTLNDDNEKSVVRIYNADMRELMNL